MTEILPECPVCKKGTKREDLGGTRTCMGWTPTYDENGTLLNSDPNIFKNAYRCLECKNVYAVESRYGEVVKIWVVEQ